MAPRKNNTTPEKVREQPAMPPRVRHETLDHLQAAFEIVSAESRGRRGERTGPYVHAVLAMLRGRGWAVAEGSIDQLRPEQSRERGLLPLTPYSRPSLPSQTCILRCQSSQSKSRMAMVWRDDRGAAVEGRVRRGARAEETGVLTLVGRHGC